MAANPSMVSPWIKNFMVYTLIKVLLDLILCLQPSVEVIISVM